MTRRPGESELTAEQWQRLEALLADALALPADAATEFVARARATDPELGTELESLLAAHTAEGPLDRPLARCAPGAPVAADTAPGIGADPSRYVLQERLGSGGMGVVYRARDLRLERTVALKFLPPHLSHDAHAKRRFLAEARAAAALEHPNVCVVHEIGETADGQLYIAMAFVEGHALRELVEQGPVPPDRAVEIARQIAAGLECAHRQGIVHRDVKPANVMLGVDGIARLIDFGIAKLGNVALTNPGTAPGTAAYMSPEQVRGEELDPRTDLWALGVVLYQMLTGQRPFNGNSDAALQHAIIHAEPAPLRELSPGISAELEGVVTRALQKDRERRFQSAAEMRDALRATGAVTPPDERLPAQRRPGAWVSRSVRRRVVAALLVVVTLAAMAGLVRRRAVAPMPSATLRLSIAAPGVLTPQLSAAISPDGRRVAFVATESLGGARLWVRDLDQLAARALPGTEHAAHPFWSPDGRSLGFIAANQLRRVDLAGGPVQTLADDVIRYGGTWGPDGTILFSPTIGEIARIPATGGSPTTVLKADAESHESLLWPQFLPDGRQFLFFRLSPRPERRGTYIAAIGSSDTKLLQENDFRAWYAPPGYLVFVRGEVLFAQPFDTRQSVLHGKPAAIAEGVWYARPAAQASFSVSASGALAYVNASLWDAELLWFNRAGRALGAAGPRVRYEGETPQISPDARRVAVARGELGRQDIWLLGAGGETASRFTFSPDAKWLSVWSADGRRVMFTAGGRLFVKDVDSGIEELVLESVPGTLQDWSRDGHYVVFQSSGSRAHLWVVRLDGDRVPIPYQKTPYNQTQAQLSPNGKWIAYTSNESGRDEVYVQAFPAPGRKRQVSSGGGAMPRWSRDGRELFYLAQSQHLTAVPIVDPASAELGAPTPLFRTRLLVEGSESTGLPTRYDVAPDGRRFLIRYPPVDPGPPITVVINWLGALQRSP